MTDKVIDEDREAWTRKMADTFLPDMDTPSLDARHVSLMAAISNGINYGSRLSTQSRVVEVLRKARAYVSIAEHDECCELDPDFGAANLECSNEDAEEAALDAGGDERDVNYRDWPDDAVCTCGIDEDLAEIDSLLSEVEG